MKSKIGITIQIFLFGLFSVSCVATPIPIPTTKITTHGIIPLPKSIDLPDGSVVLNQDFVFVTSSVFDIANKAAENVFSNTLIAFQTSTSSISGKINFRLIQDNTLKHEAYSILINSNGILLKAGDEAGAYCAVQSLKQYLWSVSNGLKQASLDAHFLTVSDEPKYEWRGFHLDVSRHFFTKEYILKIIDWLAYYKYNKFHLHLTDDQGWRIESKIFPLLNSAGSWRYLDYNDSIWSSGSCNPNYAINPQFLKKVNGRTMYGGYYTQDDIAEIVAYAQKHFVEIIPEIDMPGHMTAAIQAYPLLSCSGKSGMHGDYSYPICPCNQNVYDFVYQIWDEVTPLFPSKYVHIGADEVVKSTWDTSDDCKNFMTSNSIKDTTVLQSFFVKKLQTHLEENGKTVVAWDDVSVEPNHETILNFDSKLKIMYWRSWMTNAPTVAAANGNDIIYTNWDMFYFSSENSQAQLMELLEYDITTAYPAEVSSKVIGFQGCVWTEQIPSEKVLESLIFPRIQALSEVNWSAFKNLYSFNTRLEPHKKYLKCLGVNWVDPK